MDLQTEISRRGVFAAGALATGGLLLSNLIQPKQAGATTISDSQETTHPKFRATLTSKNGEVIATTNETGVNLLNNGESGLILRDTCDYLPNRDGSITANYEVHLVKPSLISPYTNKTEELDETYAKVKTSFTYFFSNNGGSIQITKATGEVTLVFSTVICEYSALIVNQGLAGAQQLSKEFRTGTTSITTGWGAVPYMTSSASIMVMNGSMCETELRLIGMGDSILRAEALV